MPVYRIDIRTPKGTQSFTTENIEGEVAKVRLKSFVDITLALRDFVLDIKPLRSSKKDQLPVTLGSQVECLHVAGELCPLEYEQTPESCLHCNGRGR